MTRASHLRLRFGITEEQYEELLDRHGGLCALCRKSPEDEGKSLAVDHNHKTGEIRGVLCGYCNHRILGRHTDADLLRRMAYYLENGKTGWFVPKQKPRRRKKIK